MKDPDSVLLRRYSRKMYPGDGGYEVLFMSELVPFHVGNDDIDGHGKLFFFCPFYFSREIHDDTQGDE